MNLDFPYHFNRRGYTAATNDSNHVRDMIEQLLFTAPGERVNRPEFGSGLLQQVFALNNDALAATLQMMAQAALLQWSGDVIEIQELTVENEDATLRVNIAYQLRRNGATGVAVIERAV